MKYIGGKSTQTSKILPHILVKGVCGIVDVCCGSGAVARAAPLSYKHFNDLNPNVITLLNTLKLQPDQLVKDLIHWGNLCQPLGKKSIEQVIRGAWQSEAIPPYIYWIVARYSHQGGGGRWFSGFSDGWKSLKTRLADPSYLEKAVRADAQGLTTDNPKNSIISCGDGLKLLKNCDRTDHLIYLDLPYLGRVGRDSRHKNGETRFQYAYDILDEEGHTPFLEVAKDQSHLPIAISHFDHPLYRKLLADWEMVRYSAKDGCNQDKTEILYLSPELSRRKRVPNRIRQITIFE